MYKLIIKTYFSAAHRLRGYQGNCENLHGHNWQVEVEVVSKILDRLGMVMDFRKLKEEVEKIILSFDHKFLNSLKEFKKVNPTTENLARIIFEKLSKKIDCKNLCVKKVTIGESINTFASYQKNNEQN